MTEDQYVERVRRYAREQGTALNDGDIAAAAPLALGELGNRIAGGSEASLLQRDYTVPIVSGVSGALGTLFPNMLSSTVARVLHPTHGKFSIVPHRSDLDHPKRSLAVYYGAIENDKFYGRHPDGVTPPDDADLTVQANCTPVFEPVTGSDMGVPPIREDDLVRIGFELTERGAEAGAG